jgi:hypothetical protein
MESYCWSQCRSSSEIRGLKATIVITLSAFKDKKNWLKKIGVAGVSRRDISKTSVQSLLPHPTAKKDANASEDAKSIEKDDSNAGNN